MVTKRRRDNNTRIEGMNKSVNKTVLVFTYVRFSWWGRFIL
jgi:hypothetical protein